MSMMPPEAGERRLHQQAPLHHVTCSRHQPLVLFFTLISDSYPQAFVLLMALPQRQLFILNPALIVEENPFISPSSPVSSEQAVAISSCTPEMGFVPPNLKFNPTNLSPKATPVKMMENTADYFNFPLILFFSGHFHRIGIKVIKQKFRISCIFQAF